MVEYCKDSTGDPFRRVGFLLRRLLRPVVYRYVGDPRVVFSTAFNAEPREGGFSLSIVLDCLAVAMNAFNVHRYVHDRYFGVYQRVFVEDSSVNVELSNDCGRVCEVKDRHVRTGDYGGRGRGWIFRGCRFVFLVSAGVVLVLVWQRKLSSVVVSFLGSL